jgi:hypothetical protein
MQTVGTLFAVAALVIGAEIRPCCKGGPSSYRMYCFAKA